MNAQPRRREDIRRRATRPIYDCGHVEPRAACAGLACARFRMAWAECARVTMKTARRDSRARADAAHRCFLAQLRASSERLSR